MIEREIYSKIKPYIDSPEAIVITGMRRVGKTTLLKHIMKGIKSDNKVFFDLENPVNRKLFEENDYEKIAGSFRLLGIDFSKKGYIFLDEIQFVKNLPSVVKYLYDHYKIKFFLSGSSGFYIKNVFSESLSGRKYIFELYPLTFKEFLKTKELKLSLPREGSDVTSAIFEKIDNYYGEYISYGGFPGVALKQSAEEKKMMLEDIFSSYFQLEVIQLGDFRKVNVIRDLMLLLMERIGSKLDILKLSRELGVSRDTIYSYISFLESTYFIKLVRPFSRNKDTEIRSAPKFYLCDTGLANHFSKVSEGALFENAVFLALKDRGAVNYYQKKSGVEIDFILNKNIAYEIKVKAHIRDAERLKNFVRDLKIKDYRVVSRRYGGDIDKLIYGFMI